MTFLNFHRAAAISMMAILGTGCSKPQPLTPAIPPVQTLVLQQSTTQSFRRFPGEVVAVKTTQMSFDVAGRIIERPAHQGRMMQQGELLARLDPENFQARVASANARLVNAREELTRRQQLHERGVISATEFDQFATEFRVAEAEQREAQRALDDTRLVAPFTGRVARTLVDNFTSVQPKQPVLVFQDVSLLEVDIEVPEQSMVQIDPSLTPENASGKLEAMVEIAAIPGQKIPLTLKSFQSEATPASRTFRVTFTLEPQSQMNILPGMTCTVFLRTKDTKEQTSEEGVFEIPTQAIGSANGAPVVWRLNSEALTVSAVPIEMLGPVGQSMRLRSSSLHPQDEIVISGVRFLSEGMKVGRMPSSSR